MIDPALRWCDQWFDPDEALLSNPRGSYGELGPPRSLHLVPHSAWYAAGLLGRDEAGDRARAATVLRRLCSLQYDAPGTPWHGTFARFAESPSPGPGAVEWIDYDPNWRQFLGTTFSLVVATHGAALPGDVVDAMRAAIDLAVLGEPAERVAASYSNIALMRAWLEVEHGSREQRARAELYAREVVALFDEHGAFEEYNSPTYYGIDLFALGLWARHSSSALLRTEGARLEAALWDDIARWWHASLGNLCGPWSRSYGMDMRRYAALLGLWIGPDAYPDLDRPFEHSHDTAFAPMVELVGPSPTTAAGEAVARFTGERLVEQRVSATRVATGWIDDRVMFGGERGGSHPARGQYHPATAHWVGGWLRVRHEGPVDAVVTTGSLEVRPRRAGVATLLVGGDPTPIEVHADGRRVALDAGDKVRVEARSIVGEAG